MWETGRARCPRRIVAPELRALTLLLLAGAVAHAAQPPVDTDVAPPENAEGASDLAALPEPETEASYETLVQARRPISAASSRVVRDRDFELRPHPRPAEILSVTPGLHVVQHAGGGKANQYFLRGFDADHGTDVALFVDGVPVNLVSHGHGQGYADLHWVIGEFVERIDVSQGPYAARHGDFATAGALELGTRDRLDHHVISIGGGSFGTYRGVVGLSPELGSGSTALLGAEVYGSSGPFDRSESLTRVNLLGKVNHELGARSKVSLTLTHHASQWSASGQIPLRAVRSGALGRFGSVDPSDGGASSRSSASARFTAYPTDESELSLMAYVADYQLDLYSNFTLFSRDPLAGDQIEQNDRRVLSGARGAYRWVSRLGGVEIQSSAGVDVRSDDIENALHYDRARERLADVVDAEIDERAFGLYTEQRVAWASWLTSITGARYDRFGFAVNDELEQTATVGTRSSGVRDAELVSPKATLVFSPRMDWDIFVNFGLGFHSNDARGVVRGDAPVSPLTRATGGELGTRFRAPGGLDIGLSLFALDLDSEIVWVGDEGTTEARGATRRLGAEAELRMAILPWLVADADGTLTRATFVDAPEAENAVPLAPRLMLAGGFSARHSSGAYGRIGSVYLADRPATEDRFLIAEGFVRVDATLGYRSERFELSVAAQNLFDGEWREAQFANVSRLADETSCPAGTRAAGGDASFAGCEDIHFTPGTPFNLQANASWFF